MAVKEVVVKYCNCDLCKETVQSESELTKLSLPVKFLTEQTEGRACKPYFTVKTFDLCVECLEKVTVVLGRGAQGYNDYWIKKN